MICSLGSLTPAPKEHWAGVARKLHAALEGQSSLLPDGTVDALVERAQPSRRRGAAAADHVSVDPDRVRVEEAREAATSLATSWSHQIGSPLSRSVSTSCT